MLITTKI